MNMWIIASFIIVILLFLSGILLFRSSLIQCIPVLQFSGIMTTLAILLLAQAYGQPSFYDLSLAIAILGLPGSIVFIRFMERWL